MFFTRKDREIVVKNEQRITANEARLKKVDEEIKTIPVIEAQLRGLAEGQEEVKVISLDNKNMNAQQNERVAKIESLEKGQEEIKKSISENSISKVQVMWAVGGVAISAMITYWITRLGEMM